ncbi:hypothetical protein [Streptomyces bauhiniae]|uniref:hypothetical protein n=1 Tax=Streptomyces bauhiniae TaxID=2340725 RepID=UPI0035DD5FC5
MASSSRPSPDARPEQLTVQYVAEGAEVIVRLAREGEVSGTFQEGAGVLPW